VISEETSVSLRATVFVYLFSFLRRSADRGIPPGDTQSSMSATSSPAHEEGIIHHSIATSALSLHTSVLQIELFGRARLRNQEAGSPKILLQKFKF